MPTGPRIRLREFADRGALERSLAERLGRELETGAAGAAVMLSGGSTPLPAYRTLAARALEPAPGLVLLYSDERHVPADAPDSNYGGTRPLLDALRLPAGRVLRVRTELPLAEAARDYHERLARCLASGVRIGLGLLGLGTDGHTAGLFTDEDLERGRGRLAVAVHRPDGRDGVSVTPELIARVAQPLFVVSGPEKRAALRALLGGDAALVAWRAVSGCTEVEVWADRDASGER